MTLNNEDVANLINRVKKLEKSERSKRLFCLVSVYLFVIGYSFIHFPTGYALKFLGIYFIGGIAFDLVYGAIALWVINSKFEKYIADAFAYKWDATISAFGRLIFCYLIFVKSSFLQAGSVSLFLLGHTLSLLTGSYFAEMTDMPFSKIGDRCGILLYLIGLVLFNVFL